MLKALLFIGAVLAIIFSGTVIYYYLEEPNHEKLNLVHRYVADNISDKFEQKLKETPNHQHPIISYDDLLNELNNIERSFAETIFAINPDTLGFKGPFYSTEQPKDLIMQESIPLTYNDKNVETGTQYCPRHVHEDYRRMMDSLYQSIGKTLYIDSGYRSPGRQAYLFFYYLTSSSNYSLRENAKWIAFPGYSEHAHPINTALDFVNEEGINGINKGQKAEDFEKLNEYKWLVENASKFNFYLTYGKNNSLGVNFEPWHWHWEKKKFAGNL